MVGAVWGERGRLGGRGGGWERGCPAAQPNVVRHSPMPCAHPTPSAHPNALRPISRIPCRDAKCRAPSAPRPVPRANAPCLQCLEPNAPRPQTPERAGDEGGRGGERWRSRTFSPAALAAGAFPAVADAFEWEPDTLPKNRLPVELALKLNLQLLEPRSELLPRLLSPPAPSPAFSIARRSSESQTEERQERRPSPAEAFSCAALTPWLG